MFSGTVLSLENDIRALVDQFPGFFDHTVEVFRLVFDFGAAREQALREFADAVAVGKNEFLLWAGGCHYLSFVFMQPQRFVALEAADIL